MKHKQLVSKMVLLFMSITLLPTQSEAAVTPKLSTKTITLTVGNTKTLKVKNTKKKARWSVKSGKNYIKLKAKKKASVKIVAVKKGTAKVQCKIGKKQLVCKVKVTKGKKRNNNQPAITPYSSTTPTVITTETQVTATPQPTSEATLAPTSEPTPFDPFATETRALRTPGPVADYDRLMMETSVCENYIYPVTGHGSFDTRFFGTDILREDIEQIIFSDVNEVPENVLGVLDLSEKQNESVRGWYTDEDGNGKYEMTIAQDGGVIANENSVCLFEEIGLNSEKGKEYEVLVGLEHLDTSRVTNMIGMFSNMSIPSGVIDLGECFDVSDVKEAGQMFYGTNPGNLRCYTSNIETYKWLKENAEIMWWRVPYVGAPNYEPENEAYIIYGSPDMESQPAHIETENRIMAEPQLVLREDGTMGEMECMYEPEKLYFFGSNILREEIEFMTITDHIQASEAAIETMDISEKQNGSVVAWYEDSDQDGKYEMTIGQNGGVVANEDSRFLFYGIGRNAATDDSKGRLFEGFEHLYGADIKNTSYMFAYCGDSTGSFKELNLDKFHIESQFYDCDNMFWQCGNYKDMTYYMDSDLIYWVFRHGGTYAWDYDVPDIDNWISIG